MNDFVSESITGQDEPKPSRGERDAAFSSGAGRKAVEVTLAEQERQNRHKPKAAAPGGERAPIGLDMETKADGLH